MKNEDNANGLCYHIAKTKLKLLLRFVLWIRNVLIMEGSYQPVRSIPSLFITYGGRK